MGKFTASQFPSIYGLLIKGLLQRGKTLLREACFQWYMYNEEANSKCAFLYFADHRSYTKKGNTWLYGSVKIVWMSQIIPFQLATQGRIVGYQYKWLAMANSGFWHQSFSSIGHHIGSKKRLIPVFSIMSCIRSHVYTRLDKYYSPKWDFHGNITTYTCHLNDSPLKIELPGEAFSEMACNWCTHVVSKRLQQFESF